MRSQEADRLRALVGARERLIRLRKDLEGHVRGVLKTFGFRMSAVSQGQQRQDFRDQLAAAGEIDAVLRAIADGFIAAHSTLCKATADLDRALKAESRSHPVARRLMTIPGVGPIVSLSFVAFVDDPRRFGRNSDVGAFLGLTPRRHQSGEMDWSGRVSKCGDAAMRSLLFEAATSVIRQVKRLLLGIFTFFKEARSCGSSCDKARKVASIFDRPSLFFFDPIFTNQHIEQTID